MSDFFAQPNPCGAPTNAPIFVSPPQSGEMPGATNIRRVVKKKRLRVPEVSVPPQQPQPPPQPPFSPQAITSPPSIVAQNVLESLQVVGMSSAPVDPVQSMASQSHDILSQDDQNQIKAVYEDGAKAFRHQEANDETEISFLHNNDTLQSDIFSDQPAPHITSPPTYHLPKEDDSEINNPYNKHGSSQLPPNELMISQNYIRTNVPEFTADDCNSVLATENFDKNGQGETNVDTTTSAETPCYQGTLSGTALLPVPVALPSKTTHVIHTSTLSVAVESDNDALTGPKYRHTSSEEAQPDDTPLPLSRLSTEQLGFEGTQERLANLNFDINDEYDAFFLGQQVAGDEPLRGGHHAATSASGRPMHATPDPGCRRARDERARWQASGRHQPQRQHFVADPAQPPHQQPKDGEYESQLVSLSMPQGDSELATGENTAPDLASVCSPATPLQTYSPRQAARHVSIAPPQARECREPREPKESTLRSSSCTAEPSSTSTAISLAATVNNETPRDAFLSQKSSIAEAHALNTEISAVVPAEGPASASERPVLEPLLPLPQPQLQPQTPPPPVGSPLGSYARGVDAILDPSTPMSALAAPAPIPVIPDSGKGPGRASPDTVRTASPAKQLKGDPQSVYNLMPQMEPSPQSAGAQAGAARRPRVVRYSAQFTDAPSLFPLLPSTSAVKVLAFLDDLVVEESSARRQQEVLSTQASQAGPGSPGAQLLPSYRLLLLLAMRHRLLVACPELRANGFDDDGGVLRAFAVLCSSPADRPHARPGGGRPDADATGLSGLCRELLVDLDDDAITATEVRDYSPLNRIRRLIALKDFEAAMAVCLDHSLFDHAFFIASVIMQSAAGGASSGASTGAGAGETPLARVMGRFVAHTLNAVDGTLAGLYDVVSADHRARGREPGAAQAPQADAFLEKALLNKIGLVLMLRKTKASKRQALREVVALSAACAAAPDRYYIRSLALLLLGAPLCYDDAGRLRIGDLFAYAPARAPEASGDAARPRPGDEFSTFLAKLGKASDTMTLETLRLHEVLEFVHYRSVALPTELFANLTRPVLLEPAEDGVAYAPATLPFYPFLLPYKLAFAAYIRKAARTSELYARQGAFYNEQCLRSLALLSRRRPADEAPPAAAAGAAPSSPAAGTGAGAAVSFPLGLSAASVARPFGAAACEEWARLSGLAQNCRKELKKTAGLSTAYINEYMGVGATAVTAIADLLAAASAILSAILSHDISHNEEDLVCSIIDGLRVVSIAESFSAGASMGASTGGRAAPSSGEAAACVEKEFALSPVLHLAGRVLRNPSADPSASEQPGDAARASASCSMDFDVHSEYENEPSASALDAAPSRLSAQRGQHVGYAWPEALSGVSLAEPAALAPPLPALGSGLEGPAAGDSEAADDADRPVDDGPEISLTAVYPAMGLRDAPPLPPPPPPPPAHAHGTASSMQPDSAHGVSVNPLSVQVVPPYGAASLATGLPCTAGSDHSEIETCPGADPNQAFSTFAPSVVPSVDRLHTAARESSDDLADIESAPPCNIASQLPTLPQAPVAPAAPTIPMMPVFPDTVQPAPYLALDALSQVPAPPQMPLQAQEPLAAIPSLPVGPPSLSAMPVIAPADLAGNGGNGGAAPPAGEDEDDEENPFARKPVPPGERPAVQPDGSEDASVSDGVSDSTKGNAKARRGKQLLRFNLFGGKDAAEPKEDVIKADLGGESKMVYSAAYKCWVVLDKDGAEVPPPEEDAPPPPPVVPLSTSSSQIEIGGFPPVVAAPTPSSVSKLRKKKGGPSARYVSGTGK